MSSRRELRDNLPRDGYTPEAARQAALVMEALGQETRDLLSNYERKEDQDVGESRTGRA